MSFQHNATFQNSFLAKSLSFPSSLLTHFLSFYRKLFTFCKFLWITIWSLFNRVSIGLSSIYVWCEFTSIYISFHFFAAFSYYLQHWGWTQVLKHDRQTLYFCGTFLVPVMLIFVDHLLLLIFHFYKMLHRFVIEEQGENTTTFVNFGWTCAVTQGNRLWR